jgi:hypothetical protein
MGGVVGIDSPNLAGVGTQLALTGKTISARLSGARFFSCSTPGATGIWTGAWVTAAILLCRLTALSKGDLYILPLSIIPE